MKPVDEPVPFGPGNLRPLTAAEVATAYAAGERHFHFAQIVDADFAGMNLEGATFYGASLAKADFSRARLTQAQFKGADLSGARLEGAWINATDMIGVKLAGAKAHRADFTGSALQRADCSGADLSHVNFGNARLGASDFTDAHLDGSLISNTDFSDLDVSAFCDATDLTHSRPSSIDARTLIRSYHHPAIKRFIVDCGVPPLFAEFMIDCARATTEGDLRQLMQSTFISFGGPDEDFARRLYSALRSNGVLVFFFPESARWGERIDAEVFRQLQEHDRVLLVCSKASLDRPGVLHEIRETLDREARDGGATYLLPVTIDDYLFTDWRKKEPDLAERLGRRVVGDFREGATDDVEFARALARLLHALKAKRPGT